jgi:long-chain acyl-CoA synthetase
MAAPWLDHYDESVPRSLEPYPAETLLDQLADAARSHASHPALLFKGASMSFGRLEQESDAFAAALASLGVKQGDRVGLLLPNCPQFLVAQFGAWKLGAIVAPLNPIYTEQELEGPIRNEGIETLVTLTRFYERIKRVQARTKLRQVIATNIKDYFPPVLRLLFTLFREKKDGDRVTLAPGDHSMSRLVNAHLNSTRPRPAVRSDDPAVLLLSGGTTGIPKGVLGLHRAYVVAGMQVKAWTSTVLGIGNSVILLPLPLFHVYANVGVQGLALATRNSIALVPNPRDLPDLLATIRRVKPTFFTAVPTLFSALMNHPDVQNGKVDFRSIKICFSGSSALMAETKHRFESLTGGRIVEGYSLTEAMMALCVNPVAGPNKLGSVGMPLPDVFVRIYDAENGDQEMPTGEVGEICVAGHQLMSGFWNNPAETATVLRDHTDASGTRRWLHTGDLGHLDQDGYLFIVDRKKDLIKTSGYQVWPREVEEALSTHPAVLEVGVAGVFDDMKGEIVKAWVVLRPGQQATQADLREFCRKILAPYKVPSHVEFRKELPKTLVGKILRRALRDGTA